MPVRCDRLTPTLRGEIESWIPHEYATVVYRSGHDLATKPEEERPAIRQRLEQTGAAVFAATGMPPHSLANLLMPIVPAPVPETTEAEAQEATAALSLPAPIDEHAQQREHATDAQTAEPIALDLSTTEDKPAEAATPTKTPTQPVKT